MKIIPLTFLLCGTSNIFAQSTISATNRYAYAANAGWLDFRPAAADGVVVTDTFLRGNAYAANFGWISFGAGTPSNGHTYSNTSATDYGVNLALDGKLTGYAYAANIGWINFEQTQGQPKVDLCTGQFSGFAYSANIGWISLATTSSMLATTSLSRTDADTDGIADAWENLRFGNLTTANATSDQDGDGSSDLAEYSAGTNPTDATSSLRIISYSYSANFTQATLTFTAVPTRKYRLEYDDDLAGPWTNSALGTFAPPATPNATGVITGLPTAPRRFFRAVAVNPL
ncbi:MAG: hypothetical protein HC845_08690 [Akkermansiaceae bacterium]|nr:hypothetical protein [Akkermansiaceae bacterium]